MEVSDFDNFSAVCTNTVEEGIKCLKSFYMGTELKSQCLLIELIFLACCSKFVNLVPVYYQPVLKVDSPGFVTQLIRKCALAIQWHIKHA